MHVLISDLDKNRAGWGNQVAGDRQAISQVGQIRVNAVPPGVPERFHLLRLARNVLNIAISYVPARGGPLKVGIEPDPVRRIDVNALNQPSQPLPLCE